MKKIYNVSIELIEDAKDLKSVKYFNYIIQADCSMHAMKKALEEIYEDDNNYDREIIGIYLDKLNVLR